MKQLTVPRQKTFPWRVTLKKEQEWAEDMTEEIKEMSTAYFKK